MLFDECGFQAELLYAVREHGYEQATLIQKEVIPPNVKRRDVLAGAPTDAGKTAGFTRPMLQRRGLFDDPDNGPRTLILTPTRELPCKSAEVRATVVFIAALPRVVNCELPNVPRDYVHRMARLVGKAEQTRKRTTKLSASQEQG